jgi:hypothetical protein
MERECLMRRESLSRRHTATAEEKEEIDLDQGATHQATNASNVTELVIGKKQLNFGGKERWKIDLI